MTYKEKTGEDKAMKFYIREWSEQTIVLMTDSGHVLSYFSSISDALSACADWYSTHKNEQKYEVFVQYKQPDDNYASITAVA